MARRTGMDTIFDNQTGMTGDDLIALSDRETASAVEGFPLDHEDHNQAMEGVAGDFGNHGEIDERGGSTEMDPEEYEAAIVKGVEAAENYIDTQVSPDREIAARYYRGDFFGNEVDGRSAVVMTEVRDTTLSMMPAMLRVFCGSTDAVEFQNNEGTPVDQAKEQTAYVNHIIHKDNDGFTLFYSAFKDAFVRRTGIFTWWHEEKETVTEEIHTGLNEEAFALLQMEKVESSSEDENLEIDVEVIREVPDTTMPDASANDVLEDPMMGGEPPQNFIRDVRLKRRVIKKRHKVASVPPEEFILSPQTSADLDEFALVGRRQKKTIGELVAMGHSEDDIRDIIGNDDTRRGSRSGGNVGTSLDMNPEAIARSENAMVERIFDTGFSAVDPASDEVDYHTLFVLIDKDGDGILERRKVVLVNKKIIYDEMVSEMVPFALICPDPEPHSPFGYSIADQTMDMQEIKSEIVRGVLDSLSESIVGRMGIVEGKVNIDDALSNERDALIRVKEQGAIWSLSRPFNGQNALPVLDYLDSVKARRTGVTMAPAGLKDDVLQSTATAAVEATVDASQERTEMIARIFAETGIKRLMRGLLQNVVKHQDRKRMIRLRGKPVLVDPRSFNADLDLETNVGLGRGTAAKRIQALTLVMGQQKEIIQSYGLDNKLVGLHHISNAAEDLLREVGFTDVSRYMETIDAAMAQKIREEAAAQPKPPTPEELLYKANSEKLANDAESKRRADMIKLVIAIMNDDAKRDQSEQNYYVKAAEMLGKFGVQVNEQEMRAQMEAERSADNLAADAMRGAETVTGPTGGPK